MKIVAIGGAGTGLPDAARPRLDGAADVVLAPQAHPAVHPLRTVADAAALGAHVEPGTQSAIVLGADAVGLAAVEALRARGVDVTLVETAPHVLPALDHEVASRVHDALEAHGVTVRAGVARWTLRASDRDLEVVPLDGAPLVADLVALGVAGPAAGSTAVHVCGLTLALAGTHGADLARVPHQTFHLRPAHPGGYYQGGAPVLVVLHVDADGEVLGAQAVGTAGVEARIDVLAGALRAAGGEGAEGVEGVDAAVAVGPAAAGTLDDAPDDAPRDPAQLAGLLAAGACDGSLRLWYPDELDDVLRDALVLDVRSGREYAAGHLDGALHVPHRDVARRVDEVAAAAAGRPVRVHCQTGFRSYGAHRTLARAGLDSAALSGGLTTLLETRPGTRLVRGAASAAA